MVENDDSGALGDGEAHTSLPPPPPKPGTPLPPPPAQLSEPARSGAVGSSDRGGVDRFFGIAGGVHAKQLSWTRWLRVAWWVLLLPIAMFCWASTLSGGWPRRIGTGAAALLALLGLVAATSGGSADEEVEASQFAASDESDEAPPASTTTEQPASSTSSTTTTTSSTTTTTQPPPSTSLAPAEQAESIVADLAVSGRGSSGPAIRLFNQLALLVGEPDPARPRYDRDSFFERADLDGDCIDTRHETLQEESLSFTMSVNGCSVTVGEWFDPFTGQWFTDPGDLQLDHVVALGDAWASGAWAWTDAQRKQFSNHATNLNVIYGPENQSKSDKGPAGYSPSNAAQTCAYLVQYGAVKAAWQLTISQADYDAVAFGIIGCNSTAVAAAPATTSSTTTAPPETTAPPATTIAPTTTTADCHPAYSPCLPNLVGNAINCGDLSSRQKPVTVLNPGVDPYKLDGDGDGRGCEGG